MYTEPRKIVLMNLFTEKKWRRLVDTAEEGAAGTRGETSSHPLRSR